MVRAVLTAAASSTFLWNVHKVSHLTSATNVVHVWKAGLIWPVLAERKLLQRDPDKVKTEESGTQILRSLLEKKVIL